MLPAPHRLRHRHQIAYVYRRGRYGSGGAVSAKAAPNHLSLSRATVVVSKKVAKRAVIRNRIRRRLTEQLRRGWATVKPGYDIVVSAHQNLAETPNAELEQALDQALKRSGVID